MKKLFIVVAILLSGCGASVEPIQAQTDKKVIQAVLVAQTSNTNIYKFSDNGFICYITENNTLRTSSSIWCR